MKIVAGFHALFFGADGDCASEEPRNGLGMIERQRKGCATRGSVEDSVDDWRYGVVLRERAGGLLLPKTGSTEKAQILQDAVDARNCRKQVFDNAILVMRCFGCSDARLEPCLQQDRLGYHSEI